jgi:hypothetical protein
MPRPVPLADASKRPAIAGKSVSVYDADTLTWHTAGKTGLALKPVREDREKGRFLGLVGFEPMTRSGLHQHLGVATSFVLDGSLTDYQGPVNLHYAGINLKGATHDAIAYQRSLLVSRLEAPVIYPEATDRDYALHTGPRFGSIRNPNPESEPDINVPVDALAPLATGIGGVTRKMIFDYSRSSGEHRYVQMGMIPGSKTPAFTTSALLEVWVRAGDIRIGSKVAYANCFVIVEPGLTVSIESDFGASFHAWSEARVQWADGAGSPDLFGF